VLTDQPETARSQLIIIALDINAEIVQNLEMATEQKTTSLDLVKMHEKAVTSRHDASRVLNELSERLSTSWPFIPSSAGSSSTSSLTLTLPPRSNLLASSQSPVSPLVELPGVTPFELPGIIPPLELPAVVPVELPANIPIELPGSVPENVKAHVEQARVEKDSEKSRFRRLFSRRTSIKSRNKAAAQNQPMTLPLASSSQQSLAKMAVQRSAQSMSPSPKALSWLDMKNEQSGSSNTTPTEVSECFSPASQYDSILSSSPIPTFDAPPTPPVGLAINGSSYVTTYFPDRRTIAELDDTSSILTQDFDKESVFSAFDLTPDTPTTAYSSSPISPAADQPSSAFPISPISEEEDEIDEFSLLTTTKSNSLYRKVSSASVSKPALGRPGKTNNYHNFCKGAWACRSTSPWAGLSLRTLTSATGTVVQQYQCKWCNFRSPPISASKSLPDKIHISGQGIAYRWLFLLRSHARCLDVKAGGNKNWPLPPDLPSMAGTGEFDGYEFGCLFCSVEGRETKVFKDVEGLMAHVDVRHAGQLSEETCKKARCIDGRVAEKREAWDVNVCQFEV